MTRNVLCKVAFAVIFLGLSAELLADIPQDLLRAMIKKETQNRKDPDQAVGDLNRKYKAYGCLQIRRPYVKDVNDRFGTSYKASDCLGDRKLSVWIFERYMEMYCTKERLGHEPTYEDVARIHNGGPNGWKSPATLKYWQDVRSYLSDKE